MAHLQEAMAYLQVQLFASIAQPTPEGHITGAEDPQDLPLLNFLFLKVLAR